VIHAFMTLNIAGGGENEEERDLITRLSGNDLYSWY